jgi:hypothetical protein
VIQAQSRLKKGGTDGIVDVPKAVQIDFGI